VNHGRAARQQELLVSKHFLCNCRRCSLQPRDGGEKAKFAEGNSLSLRARACARLTDAVFYVDLADKYLFAKLCKNRSKGCQGVYGERAAAPPSGLSVTAAPVTVSDTSIDPTSTAAAAVASGDVPDPVIGSTNNTSALADSKAVDAAATSVAGDTQTVTAAAAAAPITTEDSKESPDLSPPSSIRGTVPSGCGIWQCDTCGLKIAAEELLRIDVASKAAYDTACNVYTDPKYVIV